jgi:hypothetical protein
VKHEKKKPKEHWFREHAEATPIQYLPEAVVTAIRAVLDVKEGDKLDDIKQIIEIYDDLLKEGKASGTSGTRD